MLVLARLPETAPHRILGATGRERLAGLATQASSDDVVRWIGFAFGAEFLLATAVLAVTGITAVGVGLALRLTARLAFPLFWLAYAGGALTVLFAPRFELLRRQARVFGLAFAAAMTVHLALVATLCVIGAAPAASVFVIFGTAAACMYTLALFSIARLRQALGPRGWKVLSFVAMNYVGLAFLSDFSNDLFAGGVKHALSYWPFLALTLAGPTLRFAAFWRARRVKRAQGAPG